MTTSTLKNIFSATILLFGYFYSIAAQDIVECQIDDQGNATAKNLVFKTISDDEAAVASLCKPDTNKKTLSIPPVIRIGEKKYKVTEIADRAFADRKEFTNIILPEGITYIGHGAFSRSGLTSIVIPNTVISLGTGVFYSCSDLTQCILSENLKTISAFTFCMCIKLTEITIPNSVTCIDQRAFVCPLTKIQISNRLVRINEGAFSGCHFRDIDLPSSLIFIGDNAFLGCKELTSITIPEGVKNINYGTFSNCKKLTLVNLPSHLRNIYPDAFKGCEQLKISAIKPLSSQTQIWEGALDGMNKQ